MLVCGLAFQQIGLWRDRRRFPPPGTLCGGGLHVSCSGTGTPAVVLEAGIAASSIGWARVVPGIAEFTRVCAYDRPGFAWSEPCAHLRSVAQFDREFASIVEHAGAPVVLVGHSFGGLLVRLYAARHPEQVAGVVLVDPALTEEWADPDARHKAMLRRGIRLSRRGAVLAHLGFVRAALTLLSAGMGPLARLIAQLSSGTGGSATTRRLVGEITKLPMELWPVIRAHWSRPSTFRSMAEHLECLPGIAAAARESVIASEIPVVVISGAHQTPAGMREHSRWGVHIVAEGSGHWVQADRPDVVIEAVRNVVFRNR